jgi:sn-glycerol 3-phosphate transport system ATP-binding protein
MSLIAATGAGGVLRLGDGTALVSAPIDGAVLAGVRPEAVDLSGDGPPLVPVLREDLGSHVVQVFRLPDGQRVTATLPHGSGVPAEPRLGIPPAALHLFDAARGLRLPLP